MKKRVKRTKAKSTSKRARAKSKTKKTTKAKAKTPAKAKKTLLPKAKQVAKKAALAAGVAAIGTALSELQPKEQKRAQQGASDQSDSKRRPD
jgi:hypothetical protein